MEKTTVLLMNFTDAAGKQRTLRLPEPRADVTAAEVQAAMQRVCDVALFGTRVVNLKGAKVVATDTQELAITLE